jgi:hypothetical protein
MAVFRVALLAPFNFKIGTIGHYWYLNCTKGIPVADILTNGNLYGTIVNVYINNISYC